MKITENNLYFYLMENASVKGDCRFLFNEEESYSSKEILNTTITVANYLNTLGIKKGTIVALRATRSIETTILFYAIEIIGALLVLCDPHNKVTDILKDSKVEIKPDFILTNEDSSKDISYGKDWVLKDKNYSQTSPIYIHKIEEFNKPNFDTDVNIKDPALIVFTSGSTGKNKAVMLSQYNYLNHIQNYCGSGCYITEDISVLVLPLFHVFGIASLLMALIMKYELYFPKITDADYVALKLLEYKVTRMDGVPTYAAMISNFLLKNNLKSSYLRVGVLGGAPSSFSQFCFLEDTLNCDLLPVYGMSECIAISAANNRYSREDRSNSVGAILPLCDVRVVDNDDNVLGINSVGEITVNAPSVMIGYYGDEEATNEVLRDGYLYTGDLGYIDEKNLLHIVGRKKDIIISHGNNISSIKIEKAIEEIEDVKMAAVVGIKDDKSGEAPGALIVLNDGFKTSIEELYDKISKLVQKNEMPIKILVVDSIPMTSTNKINKLKVKEILNG